MEVSRAANCGDAAESFALAGLWRWSRKESVDESAEIEAGASGDDGNVSAFDDACESFAGLAAVVTCGAGLIRPRDVDHVVWDEGTLFLRGLGGADLHLAVDGN